MATKRKERSTGRKAPDLGREDRERATQRAGGKTGEATGPTGGRGRAPRRAQDQNSARRLEEPRHEAKPRTGTQGPDSAARDDRATTEMARRGSRAKGFRARKNARVAGGGRQESAAGWGREGWGYRGKAEARTDCFKSRGRIDPRAGREAGERKAEVGGFEGRAAEARCNGRKREGGGGHRTLSREVRQLGNELSGDEVYIRKSKTFTRREEGDGRDILLRRRGWLKDLEALTKRRRGEADSETLDEMRGGHGAVRGNFGGDGGVQSKSSPKGSRNARLN